MTNKRPILASCRKLLFQHSSNSWIYTDRMEITWISHAVCGWMDHCHHRHTGCNWLEKRLKIRKKLGSALIIIGVLALMGTLGYFAVSWLVSEVSSLIKDFPEMYVQLEKGLHQIGISMVRNF